MLLDIPYSVSPCSSVSKLGNSGRHRGGNVAEGFLVRSTLGAIFGLFSRSTLGGSDINENTRLKISRVKHTKDEGTLGWSLPWLSINH